MSTALQFLRIPGHVAVEPTYQLTGADAVVEWTIILGVGHAKVHARRDLGQADEGPLRCRVLDGSGWHDSRTLTVAEHEALRRHDTETIRSWMGDEYMDTSLAMRDTAEAAA